MEEKDNHLMKEMEKYRLDIRSDGTKHMLQKMVRKRNIDAERTRCSVPTRGFHRQKVKHL